MVCTLIYCKSDFFFFSPSLLLFSLQSMVQSYLEGVGWGLEQLQEAGAVLMQVSQALKKTGLEASHSTDGVRSLEKLREVSVHHRLLLTAVSNLPRLYSGELRIHLHYVFRIYLKCQKRIKSASLFIQE